MVELTADRLVLVENGGAIEYAGSIDDYIDFVLGRNQPKAESKAEAAKADRKAAAKAREEARALKKAAAEAEAASARLAAQCSALDRAMFDPASAPPELANTADERAEPAPRRRSPPNSKPPRRAGSKRASSSSGWLRDKMMAVFWTAFCLG